MRRKIKINSAFILLLFPLLFSRVNAQSWAAPGAVWHYTYSLFTFDGYIKIQKLGDTLINGYTCDVLKKTRIGYNYMTSMNDTVQLGREYTRLSNDTVYNFRNSQFYILYCFNANPGDSWIIAGNNINCSATDTINVDSIGTTVINSVTLRYIWTSPSSINGWRYTNRIIEKIGCRGYMFPEPYCLVDINEGGPFRCYNDSSGWSYQTGIVPYCDYTTSINALAEQNGTIEVFPNPFSSLAEIIIPERYFSKNYSLVISDILGEPVLEYSILNSNIKVDGELMSSGIYFLTLSSPQNKNIISGKLIRY